MTNRVGLVYAKNYTKLLRPIKSSTFHEKTRQDNDVTDHTCAFYVENKIELL